MIAAMVQAFNVQLDTALSGDARVLLVDAYALGHETAANPAGYGLTNVTDTACDLNAARNPLQSSLVCNGSNLKPGDVSRCAYADEV
ncbi:MAG: esterase, partial [Variovorax sp.]|nr:esterase [Variovorax sp.]